MTEKVEQNNTNTSCQEPVSVPYLLFLYKDELRGRNRIMEEPEFKYELKYDLTDELVHKNFVNARKFTPDEVGNMQDSVIYKKRLRMLINKIKTTKQKQTKKIGVRKNK